LNSQNALAGDENTYTLNLGPRMDHMHLVLFPSGVRGIVSDVVRVFLSHLSCSRARI